MPGATEDIIKRLQEILAREAATLYPETVLKTELAEFIRKLTQVVDWEDDFLSEVYNLYLRKISITGNKLSDKMTNSSGE